MQYQPKPIDTSGIDLPEGIELLMERLAANAHDVWAQRKISEGWTYGPVEDRNEKLDPDLVPYDELPASKKEYDRDAVRGVIKGLLALGFEVVPPI